MRPKKSFSEVIYKKIIYTITVSMIVYTSIVIIFFIAIYFSIVKKYESAILTESAGKISRLMDIKSESINRDLAEISKMAKLFQSRYQFLFETVYNSGQIDNKTMEKIVSREKIIFERAANGVFYKTNRSGSGVYFSADTVITEEKKRKAIFTEIFDHDFMHVVNSNPLIVSVYFNTWDNMCRIYPDMEGRYESYGPVVHLSNYNFYYEADIIRNPGKAPVWNTLYLDPAGCGWIISCIVPVYNGNFLEGVLGFDIDLHTIIERILKKESRFDNHSTMLIDNMGTVIAMGEKIEELAGIKEIDNLAGERNLPGTVLKPGIYNILNNHEVELFSKMVPFFIGNEAAAEIIIGEESYLTKMRAISENNWKVAAVYEKKELLTEIVSIKFYILSTIFILCVLMLILHIPLVSLLGKKTKNIALGLSSPVNFLSSVIRDNPDKIGKIKYESDIIEIDILTDSISKLIKDLRLNNKKLIKSELARIEKEKAAEAYMKMSFTDALTQMNNRLKIDAELDKCFKLFKRYKTIFSVVIFDLDNFKDINDKYGHLKGDQILKKIARIIKSNSRETDMAGRWGGEEFIVIIPETENHAALFAEKLRSEIEKSFTEENIKCTASFGIAQVSDDDTIESLLNNADKALYKAKQAGKNRVFLFRG